MFLKVLARKAKNKYLWKGFAAVPKALQELKVVEITQKIKENDFVFRIFELDMGFLMKSCCLFKLG
jgi:hypothetical protein